MIEHSIEISDRQSLMPIRQDHLKSVIQRVLVEEQMDSARIGVALVDDAEIHRVNREFLGHDYPTDVISFPLYDAVEDEGNPFAHQDSHMSSSTECQEQKQFKLEGELIVSTETARREAFAHGWSPDAELLLYVVHGLLHLCGYDDIADEERAKMRSRERELLAIWGLSPTGLEA